MNLESLSIYVHYPFCKSKCPYCDFNSHVSKEIDYEKFCDAYLHEIEFFYEKIGKKRIKTIFFGGGTPSLMPIFMVEKILHKISGVFEIDENCEITLEANPTSFEAQKFADFKKAGINRVSLGVQALNDEDLRFLGRNHSSKEAIAVIGNLREIFDNFSFDLIYARPNQNAESWEKELEFALDFDLKHLSLYQLTIEKGTQFFKDFRDKKFKMPSEENSAELYELTNEIMAKNGFVNYEISNYAKKYFESKHNLAYWQSDDYIGIGAGAHSRAYFKNDKNRKAIMMKHLPQIWLENVLKNGNGVQKIENISRKELAEEIVMMGLRLKNGISDEVFLRHFDQNIKEIIDFEKLQKLFDQKLLKKNELVATKNGMMVLNPLVAKICDAII